MKNEECYIKNDEFCSLAHCRVGYQILSDGHG